MEKYRWQYNRNDCPLWGSSQLSVPTYAVKMVVNDSIVLESLQLEPSGLKLNVFVISKSCRRRRRCRTCIYVCVLYGGANTIGLTRVVTPLCISTRIKPDAKNVVFHFKYVSTCLWVFHTCLNHHCILDNCDYLFDCCEREIMYVMRHAQLVRMFAYIHCKSIIDTKCIKTCSHDAFSSITCDIERSLNTNLFYVPILTLLHYMIATAQSNQIHVYDFTHFNNGKNIDIMIHA
jgi:hypothetical protein